MAEQIVVGLFPTLGRAEDVRSRLLTDGVPGAAIEIRELKRWERLPAALTPEREGNYFDGILSGGLPDKYVPFMRNGESAVLVRAFDDAGVAAAADTMRQFVPLAEIDVI